MKKQKRFLTLALALILSLGLFSTGAVAQEVDPIDCLQGVVYYGDMTQCRMTSVQALAYANAIEGAIGSLERKNASRLKRSGERPGSIHSYAALFDLGDGTPAVLFAGGLVVEYDWKDLSEEIRADGCDWANLGSQRLWHDQKDGVAVPFDIGDGVNIALHNGYVFWGGLSPDAATHYNGKVYPLDGGKFAEEALTYGAYTNDYEHDEPVVYHVDGNVVTEAEFQAWQNTWEKSPILAGHRWTGGVGGTITGLGDARSLAATLRAYAQAAGMPALARDLDVTLDGEPRLFRAYAIKDATGAETNYVRLRDVAQALRMTDAKFNVDWDGNVVIRTGEGYDPNDTQRQAPFSGNRAYTTSTAQTVVDGVPVQLDAILLTDDAGNGYTYYQLRDLGKALGFNVGWSADKGVFVETDKPYDPAN